MRNALLTLIAAAGALTTPIAFTETVLAQQLVDLNPPLNGQNVFPDTSISGQFNTDTGAAVDANSVRILVNGRDVTNRSTITRNFFTYRPDQPFPPGQVQVQVQYRNVNGQQRNTNWAFNVQQAQAVQITSVTHNAAGNPQNTGASFLATVNGTPGSQATVLLIQDGRTVREVPAQEVSSGVYVATLNVQQGDRVNEGIVVGRLRRQNQSVYAAASQPFVFNATGTSQTTQPGTSSGTGTTGGTTTATADLKPRFTSHQDNGEVSGSGFTLIGQTRPNARVQVNVTSRVSVLGVNLGSIGSETLLNREVRANNSGEFRVQVPGPRIPVPGTQYTVRATASADNTTSEPTEITLRQD